MDASSTELLANLFPSKFRPSDKSTDVFAQMIQSLSHENGDHRMLSSLCQCAAKPDDHSSGCAPGSGYAANYGGYSTNSGYTTTSSAYTTNSSGYTTNSSGYTSYSSCPSESVRKASHSPGVHVQYTWPSYGEGGTDERTLAAELASNESELTNAAFLAGMSEFQSLLGSSTGSVLAERLVRGSSPDQVSKIVSCVEQRFVHWCRESSATVPLQRLICRITAKADRDRLIVGLRREIATLIVNFQANLILQQMIVSWPLSELDFIVDAVVESVLEFATHRRGCLIVQQCLRYFPEPQRERLIDAIIAHTSTIACDAFGNYVFQYVVKVVDPSRRQRIALAIVPRNKEHSKQKFSSNVIERLLEFGDDDSRELLIGAIVSDGVDGVKGLMLNRFANYVVQLSLNLSTNPGHIKILVKGMRKSLEQRRQMVGGKRMAAKLQKKFPDVLNPDMDAGMVNDRIQKNLAFAISLREQLSREPLDPFDTHKKAKKPNNLKVTTAVLEGLPSDD
ncbi:MAG: uncharacterized protein KVP18_004895 [Porospora cf. gigantea A]|uniref:uncharacterized protein n=1 Tax=Porospora cf. gigantea A TaxID=2853593 RepID=UPI003559CFED|nr:MAG: hypothetical protein KVP18_004895 [Porospora cf. gigantea A]